MGSRQFDPRHMAGDAFVFRYRTSLGSGLPSAVTRLALRVIVYGLCTGFGVGVMAGQATDSRIVGVVALAAPKPIRLEANVVDTVVFLYRDFCPGAVAAAAEVGCLFSAEIVQIG